MAKRYGLAIFVVSTLSIAPSFGAPIAPSYRAGLNLGFGVPTRATAGGTRLVYGADFYSAEKSDFDFGLSYLTGGSRVKTTDRLLRANFLGGELNYKLGKAGSPFYIGASAGVMSFDGGYAFLPSFSDLYVGPKLGFSSMLSNETSWGLEGKILFIAANPSLGWIDILSSIHLHF